MDALDQLNAIACWDYQIKSFHDGRLLILGSCDFCYYHLVEAEFREVSFISCPTIFCESRFRLGSPAEKKTVAPLVGIDQEDILFAIDAHTWGSLDPQVFFIVATGLQVTGGTVYYYERENLQPGERIADWVVLQPASNPNNRSNQ